MPASHTVCSCWFLRMLLCRAVLFVAASSSYLAARGQGAWHDIYGSRSSGATGRPRRGRYRVFRLLALVRTCSAYLERTRRVTGSRVPGEQRGCRTQSYSCLPRCQGCRAHRIDFSDSTPCSCSLKSCSRRIPSRERSQGLLRQVFGRDRNRTRSGCSTRRQI